MVTLNQKLKMLKTFLQDNTLCSMQKTAPKKQLIFENWDHFKKMGKMATKQRL